MTKFKFATVDQPFECDWPVEVSVPQDGGTVETQTFTARFRMLAKEEIEDIIKTDKDGLEMYRRYFVGLGADQDETLTPELLAKLLSRPYVKNAIFKAYQGFSQGIAAKNS